MATFLVESDGIVKPYCSSWCANRCGGYNWRKDDRYEFDERCHNCDALIRASA